MLNWSIMLQHKYIVVPQRLCLKTKTPFWRKYKILTLTFI